MAESAPVFRMPAHVTEHVVVLRSLVPPFTAALRGRFDQQPEAWRMGLDGWRTALWLSRWETLATTLPGLTVGPDPGSE